MMADKLAELKVIPVLRNIPYDKSEQIIQALLDGGIKSVEVTMESDRAEDIIRHTREVFSGKVLVGAGTVLTLEDCERALAAGAEFIVSPSLNEEVVTHCVKEDVPVIPGVFTPSEMLRASQLGTSTVKLFPASAAGPGFIKDVKGPLPHIQIMSTGGISLDSAKSYLDAGAIAVGAGGALLRKDLIAADDWAGLTSEAEKWMSAVSTEPAKA